MPQEQPRFAFPPFLEAWRLPFLKGRMASMANSGGAFMTTFDDRADAFEKKFAHDQDLQFKATARRNKLLGLWAAAKLGKTAEEAEAYAKSVLMADFEEAGDDDVLRKVRADLAAGGVPVSDTDIRQQMDALLTEAKKALMEGR